MRSRCTGFPRTVRSWTFRSFFQVGTDDATSYAATAAGADILLERGLDLRYEEVPEGDHWLWLESPDFIDPLFQFFDDVERGVFP